MYPLRSKTFRPSVKTVHFSSLPAEFHFKGPGNTVEMTIYLMPVNQWIAKEEGGNMVTEAKMEPLNQLFLFKKYSPCPFKTQVNTDKIFTQDFLLSFLPKI